MKAYLAVPLAVLALSACSGQSLVYNNDFRPSFAAPGMVPLGGTQPVEMHGTPPRGLSEADFARLMSAPPGVQYTSFTPADPGPRAWRFVVSFGRDANTALCEEAAPGDNPDVLAMSLCNGPVQVSRASLRMTPDRPLQQQIDQLMYVLLTPPNDSPDDRNVWRRT
ncbi:hypothetical protein FDP22_13790 [Paroceanicella profunda]|uniref:Lipoprotein n=1 Tax=Paroceanicella profunda TaxID=2579971 RepID=A0A5B8FYP2_9RHOB|nr:hypothetical protein [Paroceanicella profunda]QDL92764.1 hypothetical protein FDP22_13790 [Paroceanicella profunda]